ncbi:MAG: radical SAM protein [Oscillospiraceae bacterium]|nr:radical SAM protein [Oscillospiraceae bacterium]
MQKDIWDKINNRIDLSKEDAVELLNINNTSDDFYMLLSKANELSRKMYNNRAYIFAQIGINSAPCSGNCKFCSLAKDTFSVESQFEKDAAQIVSEAQTIAKENIEALFLMTTADFDKEKFISIAKAVKEILPGRIQLIANIGDFDLSYAERLRTVGFSGAYHIVRLREGIDTNIPKENRIATIEAIKAAGLELYYCVEPIGREHTYEEIADEMIRAREYEVDVMAVMGRVNVSGTIFENSGVLSELELTKIAAVTRIVTNPKKSMNVHEPTKMPLLAGVNQLYAEYGVNPRDTNSQTELNRGVDIRSVENMLLNAEYLL